MPEKYHLQVQELTRTAAQAGVILAFHKTMNIFQKQIYYPIREVCPFSRPLQLKPSASS